VGKQSSAYLPIDPEPSVRLHKVVLIKNNEELFGYIALVEVHKHRFFLLDRNQVGMVGTAAGREIQFSECAGLYPEDLRRPGTFDPTEQITELVAWGRSHRMG
jgi:hypothetical protein